MHLRQLQRRTEYDNILVDGRSENKHNENLLNVLRTLEEAGLTVNSDKCAFYKDEVVFFGLRFTKDGISPTDDRCKALREATPPGNVKELRSLLGMVQFSARFIKELAHITEPLWRLTKDGVKWTWDQEQQHAFEALKRAITDKCLAFYNREWKTEAHEITRAADGVLLRGSQILVPSSLRERVVQIAHRGHQGIVQTKRLIRARL